MQESLQHSEGASMWWQACNAQCPFKGFPGHELTHRALGGKLLELTDLAAVLMESSKAKKSAPIREKSLLGNATGYAK